MDRRKAKERITEKPGELPGFLECLPDIQEVCRRTRSVYWKSSEVKRMNRYVLVGRVYKSGYQVALQILESDEPMPTTLPVGIADAEWYDITGDTTAHVGWKVFFKLEEDGLLFVEPTHEEHLAINAARMQERFDVAALWLTFNPLQYKLDLGVATPADEAALLAYKQYFVAVSEVKKQPGYPATINWPVAPF